MSINGHVEPHIYIKRGCLASILHWKKNVSNDAHFSGSKGGRVHDKHNVKFQLNDHEMIVFHYAVFLICYKHRDRDSIKVGDIMKKRKK